MKKRIFSLFLACVMLLSAVPVLFLVSGAEEGEVSFTSSFWEEAQAGKITYDAEAGTVTYGGAWQAAFYMQSGTTYTPVPLSHLDPTMRYGNVAVTEPCHSSLLEHPTWDLFYWGSPNGSGAMRLNDYAIVFGNENCIPLYLYTVTEEGEFDISVEIENFITPEAGREYFFSIMVNEQMIWPVYGASFAYTSARDLFTDEEGAWYHVTSETTAETLNEALQTLRMTAGKGDRIEFCYRYGAASYSKDPFASAMPKITAKPASGEKIHYAIVQQDGKITSAKPIENNLFVFPEYTGEATFIGWDINGDGMVDAFPGATLDVSGYSNEVLTVTSISVGISRWFDNFPVIDDVGIPTYVGGWQTGAFNKSEGLFYPYGGARDKFGIHSINDSPWGGTGGGLYCVGSRGQVALSGCTAEGDFLGEINYTAGYNGIIEFGLDQMILEREGGSGEDYIAYDFAVYKNGEKIWPADSEWFHASSAETNSTGSGTYDALADFYAAGFPLTIEVEKDDVIALRTQQSNSITWMLHPKPTVTYTTLSETPLAVKADITISEDLGFNFYVCVVNAREDVEVGLEYWTSKPNETLLMRGGTPLDGTYDDKTGFYKFTYDGISAKKMADLIYVRPYSYVGEDIIYGAVAEFSVQKYADAAFGQSDTLDKLLGALLTYGAQTQVLFGYNNATEKLANTNVPVALRPSTFNDNLNNVYAQGEGENPITGASLLLNNRLGFKFVVEDVEGAESYVLEYAESADFADSKTVDMVATKTEAQHKASFDISFAELGKTFYVRAVIDGEAGATLTYSFESYFDRVQDDCDFGLYYALSALATYERALAEYLG